MNPSMQLRVAKKSKPKPQPKISKPSSPSSSELTHSDRHEIEAIQLPSPKDNIRYRPAMLSGRAV